MGVNVGSFIAFGATKGLTLKDFSEGGLLPLAELKTSMTNTQLDPIASQPAEVHAGRALQAGHGS